MVSSPARCLAMASAYLLNVRELSRLTCEHEGEGCVDRRALCEQKVNNEFEPRIRLAWAFRVGYSSPFTLFRI